MSIYGYTYIYTSKIIIILEWHQEILKKKWFKQIQKNTFKTFTPVPYLEKTTLNFVWNSIIQYRGRRKHAT